MDLGGINLELVGLLLTYIFRIFTKNKNEKLDRAAYLIQGIVLNAISKTRSSINGDVKNNEELKNMAIDLVSHYINNKKVDKAIKRLGINIDKESIGEYIEIGLHAGKQGFNNVLKDRFRGI